MRRAGPALACALALNLFSMPASADEVDENMPAAVTGDQGKLRRADDRSSPGRWARLHDRVRGRRRLRGDRRWDGHRLRPDDRAVDGGALHDSTNDSGPSVTFTADETPYGFMLCYQVFL